MRTRGSTQALQSVVALLGSGALFFLLNSAMNQGWTGRGSSPGNVHCWIADRDGAMVVALDDKGLIVCERELSGVMELASAPDSTLWALRAGSPGTVARSLERLTPFPGTNPSSTFGEGARCLGVARSNCIALIARIGGENLWLQLDERGRLLGSVPAGDARGWVEHGQDLALVGETWVRWCSASRGPREWRLPPGGRVLAHCAMDEVLWLLVHTQGETGPPLTRLWSFPGPMQLDQELSMGASFRGTRGAWRLISGAPGSLWIVNSLGRAMCFNLSGGAFTTSLLQAPIQDAIPDGTGGLLALSPGGVQRLAPDGTGLPGQGGFSYLSACALSDKSSALRNTTKGLHR